MLREISPYELSGNVFGTINKDWLLITVRDGEKTNAMTASWGGMGVMWGKPVAFLFVRPQRHTKALLDRTDALSVSVLPDGFRKELSYFGSVSGRDEDKIAQSGLKLEMAGDLPYFADAKAALLCKKLYVQALREECFTDKEADKAWYPQKDYHIMYVVEIERALEK